MKQYEIFFSLENGNYVRETVYGKQTMKARVKELKTKHENVRVFNEYGFKLWWI